MNDNNPNEEWKLLVLKLKLTCEIQETSIEELSAISEIKTHTIKRIFDLKFPPDIKVLIKLANSINLKVELK